MSGVSFGMKKISTQEELNYPLLLTSSNIRTVVRCDSEFAGALAVALRECTTEQLIDLWWETAPQPDVEAYRPTWEDVDAWEDVGSYVATFPQGNESDGACDVAVRIGCDAVGVTWFVRTDEGVGVGDSYPDADAARAAADEMIESLDEGMGMDATTYLEWLSEGAEQVCGPCGEANGYWNGPHDDAIWLYWAQDGSPAVYRGADSGAECSECGCVE